MQCVLVERLEREHPRGPAADRAQRVRADRPADLGQQAGDEPTAEDHEHGDAVGGRGEEDRAQQRERDHDHDREGELGSSGDDIVRPPASDQPGGHGLDREQDHDVERTDARSGEEAREQERAAADRADDERLEQSALGISPHDSEGQEDRQYRAEEESREHRQAEDGRPGDDGRVETELVRRNEPGRVPERAPDADPVQGQEGDREQQHDQKDLAPHALPQRIARDDRDVAHHSTASR